MNLSPRVAIAETLDYWLKTVVSKKGWAGKLTEPCYTAAITQCLPCILHGMLAKHSMLQDGLGVRDLKITSAYVHQKPYVKFMMDGKACCCEFGDLMLLWHDPRGEHYGSVVFQLKKRTGREVECVDEEQLGLYLRWPTFELKGKKLRGRRYRIRPPVAMSGAQYMFIDEADQFSLLNVEKAHRDMVGGELTFGEFLVGFLIGQAGRTIKPCKSRGCDHWSDLMWNIRDALTREPLKCKANPSLASPSRVHGDRIQFWTTEDIHGVTPFDDAELGADCFRDEDTQGFGLIEIGAR